MYCYSNSALQAGEGGGSSNSAPPDDIEMKDLLDFVIVEMDMYNTSKSNFSAVNTLWLQLLTFEVLFSRTDHRSSPHIMRACRATPRWDRGNSWPNTLRLLRRLIEILACRRERQRLYNSYDYDSVEVDIVFMYNVQLSHFREEYLKIGISG